MKNIKISLLLIAIISMASFSSCKKKGCTDPVACNYNEKAKNDDGNCDYECIFEANKSMALVTKMTATWCGPCGGWGWTTNEEIIDELGGKAVVMSLYQPSSLNNPTATEWIADFNTQGTPNWAVNGNNRTAYSPTGGIYTSTTKSNCVNASDSTYSASPEAQAIYGAFTTEGSSITVNTLTQFYGSPSGEYYLGAYIVENGVIADQSGDAGPNASHPYVLRGSMDGNSYGTLLVNGSTGTELMENTFSMTMETEWVTENISVALVIWKKVGGSYTFVNAFTN